MTDIRKLFVMIAMILAVPCYAANVPSEVTIREKALYEKLEDVSSLISHGINFDDYQKQLSEIAILFDRYVRSGGERYSSVFDVVRAYRKVGKQWEDRNRSLIGAAKLDPEYRLKTDESQMTMLRLAIASASSSLKAYSLERSTSKKTKPTASDDRIEKIMQETRQKLDEGDKQFDLEKADLDRRYKLSR
jgi:hypothetical protein